VQTDRQKLALHLCADHAARNGVVTIERGRTRSASSPCAVPDARHGGRRRERERRDQK
jgi:hypothetical protein